jgi:hypothetical protein
MWLADRASAFVISAVMNPLPTHSEHPADGLREAYFRHSHALLASSENRDEPWRAARACLHQRGFDLRRVETLPIGYVPAIEPIWQGLIRDGFSADEIRASNLLADSRLPGRLVGPIRDAAGRIISFWARLPQQLDRILYLSTDWKEQAGVFGLDTAYAAVAQGRVDLLLVEDIWDALLVRSHGFSAAAAIGNSPAEIGPRRWERLDELGIHRVTLVVDSFRDSHEACVEAIRHAAFSRRGPAIYVLPPAAVHGAWASWQQGRTTNAETLEAILSAQRIHGFHYLALGLVALHQGDSPWTDATRRAVLGEARRFYATAHQRNVPQLDAFFLPPLLEALGLNWADRSAWHDVWLEDTPSANGDSWADHPAVPEVAMDQPEAPSEPVAGVDHLHESATDQPAPAHHAPIITTPRPGDYCEFHHCERIVCLCWD